MKKNFKIAIFSALLPCFTILAFLPKKTHSAVAVPGTFIYVHTIPMCDCLGKAMDCCCVFPY